MAGWSRRVVAGLVLAGLAAPVAHAQTTPAPPPAMNDEARAHYDRGLSLYASKDYAGAISELEQGYAVEPRREFLFAQAQAQRLAGDCQRAVPLYQRFLATAPTATQESAAQLGLARCAQMMATTPPTVVLTPPPPPAPAPVPAPAPASWHRDLAGGALLTAGALGLGLGSAFIAAAASAPKSAPDYDRYQYDRATAERRWRVGLGSAVAGAALIAGGAYRYSLVRRRSAAASGASASASVTGALAPNFAGLALEGRF